MSYLGDLIVDKGPYVAGDLIPEPLRYPAAAQMNALRDELIELRRRDEPATIPPGPCPASVDTGLTAPWLHRCELLAGHAGDHKDGGMRWWELDEDAPPDGLRATESAQQPSVQGVDGNGPETGTAGVTDERAREDA